MRKRPATRPVVAAAVAVALLLLCAGVYRVSAADDGGAITTTLHPGWNLIGWIHEETAASDVFAQVDELELIHDGDERLVRRSASDDPAALQSLQPGRGYWFHINSERPIEWSRPAEPSTRRFHLETGEQLVAWAGPSDRSISDVLLGLRDQVTIAWRWLAADQRFVPWSPNPDAPALEEPAIDRGDAVQVNLTEAVEWLHPTGNLPRIEFPGGLHQNLPDDFRETVEADLRVVVERFAAKLRFEAPADRLVLRVVTTLEAQAREIELFSAVSDAWAASPRQHGGESIIVVPWYLWQRTAERLKPSLETLAHEYFHVMQYEFAGSARLQVPGWLTEGAAVHSDVMLFDVSWLEFDRIQDLSTTLDLRERSGPEDYDHHLGNIATRFLIRLAGFESLIDFWRNLDPRVHPDRTWQVAFAESFDTTFGDFATEFYEYRRSLFTIVSGRVEAVDDVQLNSFYVRTSGGAGSSTAAVVHNVAADGAFTLAAYRGEPTSTSSYWHDLVIGSTETNCQAEVFPDGTVGWLGEDDVLTRRTFVADAETIDDFNIELPASFCQRRLIVETPGHYGANGDFDILYCVANMWRCTPMLRTGDGDFAAFIPVVGRYILRITDRARGCVAYATADGASRHVAAAHLFFVQDELTTARVPLESQSDLCSWN